MIYVVLNTGDAALLRFRSQFREGVPNPYTVPLDEVKVRAPGRPMLHNTTRILDWPPGRWRWVEDDLARVLGGLPAEVADAVATWRAIRGESFTPNPAVEALGIESVTDQAASEWRRDRAGREHASVVMIAEGIRAAAPAAYARCGELVAEVITARDEPGWRDLATIIVHLREQLPRVEGKGSKVRRLTMPPSAVEHWLARPDVWHDDGRPKLTAHNLAEHGDSWGFAGARSAEDVVETLVSLGAKRG